MNQQLENILKDLEYDKVFIINYRNNIMTKDYVTINEEIIDVLGHKVKVVTERFSDEYLDSDRFKPQCFRCCFYSGLASYKSPCICQYINCKCYSRDQGIRFEIVE